MCAKIVFDFDGTLADSLSVALRVYNQLAVPKNLRTIDLVEWQKVRTMSVPQGLKYVGVRSYQLPGLLSKGRRELQAHAGDIRLFAGIKPLAKQLVKDGHQLYVLSTNSRIVVQTVLEKEALDTMFDILNSAPVFGKAAALKKLIKLTHSDPNDIWMIGDELRDGQGARKAGVKFIGVNWGYQPAQVLHAALPVAIVQKPAEIKQIIDSYE